MWGVYICSGPGWALRVKVRNDWEEVFFERSLQPTGCLCLLFRCITRGETSNSAKGQSVIFHPNFRSVWCKHPLSCLRPLRTLSRCQLSPESRDERCHHYYLCNNTDFKMWPLSFQRVKLHPIKYTYKRKLDHWGRETTYVSEMQRGFILHPSLHFCFQHTGENIRGKCRTICWAAEIMITWNCCIIPLLSAPEKRLMHWFVPFVLHNVKIQQVMREHTVRAPAAY